MTILIAVLSALSITAFAGPNKPIWDLPSKQEIADGKANMTVDLKELVIEKLQTRTAANEDVFAAASAFADLCAIKDSDYYKGVQTRAILIPKDVEDFWLKALDLAERRYASSLFTTDCDLDALYAVLPRPWSEAVLDHLDVLVSGVVHGQSVDPLVFGIRAEILERYPLVHDLVALPTAQERSSIYHEPNVISHYVFAASRRSTWSKPSVGSEPPPFSPLSIGRETLDEWTVELKDEDLTLDCDDRLNPPVPQNPWFKI